MSDAPVGELASRNFSRILLVKPSSLGDIIHALPVLRALRLRYSGAQIDWLIGSAFAPILDGNSDLNECIHFDRKKFSRVALRAGPTRDFLRLLSGLRDRHYELVIDLQGLFRSGFLARATGAPVRIGPASAREGATLFYTHRIPDDRPDAHAVDRNLRVGRLLGVPEDRPEFPINIDDSLHHQARSLLNEQLAGNKDWIAVAPGARWETKRWPAEKFARAIDAIHARSGMRSVLLGGFDDAAMCEQITSQSQSIPVSLAGRTSIRQMAALIQQCRLLLCHDSAPMHIAVALNRPLVCLIGPTNPLRTGPYRRLDDVLRLPLSCSPCYFRKLSQCPHQHQCMRDLSVDAVVSGVIQRLGCET